MEFTGSIQNVSRDYETGKFNITFKLNEQPSFEELERVRKCEKLSVKATKYRQKRSLDANAYAWVLMQKIAEAIHSDKWEVYLHMLQLYSKVFFHVIVKPDRVDMAGRMYRTYIDLGEVNVNGKTGRQLQVYVGSSQFNTEEMAVFIDGIVRECKDLGIETMTPAEIERMKAQWQSQ